MIEYVKDIGSFVGLVTGLFYFYDRFARGRPIGSFTVVEVNGRPSARVRIFNPSQYDIGITAITVRPPSYALALAEKTDVKDTIRAAMGKVPSFMLAPSEKKEVRLIAMVKNGLALEVGKHRVTFWIWWRRGNATWLPQLPVPVFADTESIRQFALERDD